MNNELIKLNHDSSPIFNYANSQILIGRVVDIILDDKHPEFTRLGEWDSLGTIFFNEANKIVTGNEDLKFLPFAKPIHSYKKYYPLKNELVYIISSLRSDSQNNISFTDYYYIDTINIWNHPHHNALPQVNFNDDKIQNNYNFKSEGVTQQSKQTSSEISLGKEFKEKSNLKPLLPKEGDLIFESRFGSSIRFSSETISGSANIYIRNGQNPDSDEKGWIPNTEDINKDPSSIYFISNQAIPIEVASPNLSSFNVAQPKKLSSKIIYPDNLVPPPTAPSQIQNIETPLTGSETNRFTSSIDQPLTSTSSFISNTNDDFNVAEDIAQSEFESLQEVEYEGGTIGKTEVVENNNKIVYEAASYRLNKTEGFGKINNILINRYAYPVLDMIAYAEGTMFVGTKNGYDVVVGGSIIKGWNEFYLSGHPNIKVKLSPRLTSSAAGRYQFLKKSWDAFAGPGAKFTKSAQDTAAYRYLIRLVGVATFKSIHDNADKPLEENPEFLFLLDKIYKVWASISNSKGEFAYKGQGTTKPEKAYFIYKQALKKYNF